MLTSKNPRIDVDELKRHIMAMDRLNPSPGAMPKLLLGRTPRAREMLEYGASTSLSELMQHEDADFVINAYRVLLHRDPDPGGLQGLVDALRYGQVSKLDALGSLAASPEARGHNAQLAGFKPRQLLRKFVNSTIGWPIRFVTSILRLPASMRGVDAAHTRIHAQLQTLRATVDQHAERSEQVFNRTTEILTSSLERMADRLTALEDEVRDKAAESRVAEAERKMALQVLSAGMEARIQAQETAIAQAVADAAVLHKAVMAHEVTFAGRLEKASADLAVLQEAVQTRNAAITSRLEKIGVDLHAVQKALDEALGHSAARIDAMAIEVDRRSQMLMVRIDEKGEEVRAQLAATQGELRQEIATSDIRVEAVAQRIDDVVATITGSLQEVINETSRMKGMTRLELLGALETMRGEVGANAAQLQDNIGALTANLATQGEDLKRAMVLAEQTSRSIAQIEALRRSPTFERIYESFEDRLRGSRDEIVKRLGVYRPIIEKLPPEIKARKAVDLGCGRGEWLEIMKEMGLDACGVDINAGIVGHNLKRGLNVVEMDLLDYLRQQSDGSLGVVTAFHVVEHLPLELRLQLIKEAARVLAPNGIVVFETPNPENLIVGSCDFYLDPTHQSPIVPLQMMTLMQTLGFPEVKILRLNKHPSPPPLDEGASKFLRTVHSLLFGALDFAVIGHKT